MKAVAELRCQCLTRCLVLLRLSLHSLDGCIVRYHGTVFVERMLSVLWAVAPRPRLVRMGVPGSIRNEARGRKEENTMRTSIFRLVDDLFDSVLPSSC
jgi:hypothetical protein